MYQSTATNKSLKTVYLIRHAESNENVIYSAARRLAAALTDCSMPTFADLGGTLKIPFQMFRSSVTDAHVSEHGRQQIQQLHRTLLDDGFLINQDGKRNVRVVHSPLKRAKQTAYGIFEGAHAIDECLDSSPQQHQHERLLSSSSVDRSAPNGNRSTDTIQFEELELLREVNPREMLVYGNRALDKRIALFEEWIEGHPDDLIVVVGHSVYFKRMLRMPSVFANCDVWKLKYALHQSESQSEPKQSIITSSLSEAGATGGGGLETHVPPRSWCSLKHVYKYQPTGEGLE